MPVTISTDEGRTVLSAPYHPDLPAGAKRIGGQFDGTAKTWAFDARDEDRVRELARDIYGTDGTSTAVVTVRCDLAEAFDGGDSFWLAGRLVARRPGRDAEVRLGDGVVIITGGFPGRGGSSQYPTLNPKEGTVLEVRDLPAGHKDLSKKGVKLLASSADQDGLVAERERLRSRLAEIDQLLNTVGSR